MASTEDNQSQSHISTDSSDQVVNNKNTEVESGVEPTDVELATQLYNSLNDPGKAKDIVKFLASKAGLQVLEEDITPRKAVKEVTEDLKEGVPENLHFLIDGLKPAIEKLINRSLNDQLEPIRENSMSLRERQVMGEINSACGVMRERYDDWDKIEPKLATLADEMPNKPGGDLVKYLDRLYTLYNADAKESKAVKQTVDKINRKAKEDTNIKSAETSENTVSVGSKLPSLREAVTAAIRGQKFQ